MSTFCDRSFTRAEDEEGIIARAKEKGWYYHSGAISNRPFPASGWTDGSSIERDYLLRDVTPGVAIAINAMRQRELAPVIIAS
jgi:hypothetical protein